MGLSIIQRTKSSIYCTGAKPSSLGIKVHTPTPRREVDTVVKMAFDECSAPLGSGGSNDSLGNDDSTRPDSFQSGTNEVIDIEVECKHEIRLTSGYMRQLQYIPFHLLMRRRRRKYGGV